MAQKSHATFLGIIDLQEHILSHFGINGVSISNIFDDEGFCFHPSSCDITISEKLQTPRDSLKVLTNELDKNEFFVSLVQIINYYSELWLINMGNLTDKSWYDIYERNTIKYDKFNGLIFDL